MINTIDLPKSHTSVRKYKDETISNDTFHRLIHAAQHTASSNFVQAYSVIQVKDPKKKEMLSKLSRNELQFQTAALSLLFCADFKKSGKSCSNARGKDKRWYVIKRIFTRLEWTF